MFYSELGLDGSLRPVRGMVPALLAAAQADCPWAVVAAHNSAEAVMVPGLAVAGCQSLRASWPGRTEHGRISERLCAGDHLGSAAIDIQDHNRWIWVGLEAIRSTRSLESTELDLCRDCSSAASPPRGHAIDGYAALSHHGWRRFRQLRARMVLCTSGSSGRTRTPTLATPRHCSRRTDDRSTFIAQGWRVTDPQVLADVGPVPEHEAIIEIPEDVLKFYVRKYQEEEGN